MRKAVTSFVAALIVGLPLAALAELPAVGTVVNKDNMEKYKDTLTPTQQYFVRNGQTIPVMVDRVDPHKISVQWSELPKTEEALRQHQERIDERSEQSLRAGEAGLEKARQMLRERLERARITPEQYEQGMRKLDKA